MIRSLLLAGLVGGASATLTNTTRQTLLQNRLTNQSHLESGKPLTCNDLGRHCNQNNDNCTARGQECFAHAHWLCGAEAKCCVEDGYYLETMFNYGDAHFCDGAPAVGDFGRNHYCCSGQCCTKEDTFEPDKLDYKCGHTC